MKTPSKKDIMKKWSNILGSYTPPKNYRRIKKILRIFEQKTNI
jgi:hypothetical protein